MPLNGIARQSTQLAIIRIQAPGRFRKESFENYLEAVFCPRDAVVMAEGRTECDQEVVKLTHHFVATASDAFRTRRLPVVLRRAKA
jgi:hypothetical protein